MHICFIALGNFTHIGAYLDFFSRNGHDVTFVALTQSPPRSVRTYVMDPFRRWSRFKWKGKYILAAACARRMILGLKPDIVHAHYATSAGLAALCCGKRPYAVTAHGSDIVRGASSYSGRCLLRRVFGSADCINAVSLDLARRIADLGISESAIEVLNLGIDTSVFKYVPRPSNFAARDPLRLVCTRRLEAVYGHHTLLRAIPILEGQGVRIHLTLVGDGPLRCELEQLAIEQGIKDRVSFLGTVPNGELPKVLQGHEAYVSPSIRDGASLSLLEALASGLFPIVSDIPANREWLAHMNNGLLHTVGDPADLARCVMSFYSQREHLRHALPLNRKLVLARGDRVRNMRRLESLLVEVVEKARSSGS